MSALRATPVLTNHARQRCAEMGVRTKRVKRIMQDPDVVRPSKGMLMAVANFDPELCVLFTEEDGKQVVVTVLWRSYTKYVRGVDGR